MMKRILMLLFIIVANIIFAKAELPFFRLIQIDREISNLRVNVIYQDKNGFIWTGTDNGLYRYDGFIFQHFEVTNFEGENKVTAIAEDINGSLLIGLNNGKILLKDEDKFKVLKSSGTSPVKKILDYNGLSLWVATYGDGIFYKNSIGWHRVAGLPDPYIYTIVKHPSGLLLAGSDLGLIKIDPRGNQLHYKVIDDQSGLPDNMVRDIHVNDNGSVMIGMQDRGICNFDLKTGIFKIPEKAASWNYGAVTCLARLQNEYWVGTEDEGIVDFEFQGDQRLRHFGKDKGFAYASISCMIRDKQGNIWMSADNKLLFSPGEEVETILSDRNIAFDSTHAITTDRLGNIWMSNEKGLFKFDYTQPGSVRKYLTEAKYRNLHIVSLFEDEEGYIWIGTFDNGLYRLEPVSGNVKSFSEKDGLKNANVIAINGRGKNIWLATLGGVTLCERPDDTLSEAKGKYNFNNFPDKNGPGNVFVYCVYIDSKNRVWFGTDGRGIILFENGRFSKYDNFDKGKGKVVYSITEDPSGKIWFSTLNHGLYRFDGKVFRNFGINNGLRDLNIFGVTNNKDGNIVVVHSRGIDLINPGSLEFEYIGREAGIESLDCDLNAITRDYKGNIWIGTSKGLMRFFKYSKAISHTPETHIQRIYTFMKPGGSPVDSIFKYTQNQISIEYIGLWYNNPESVSYRYRLIGYSNKWINTRDRIVTYPNLPNGRYVFEVMSSENNQFVHPTTARFNFKILKPFWKEAWFVALMILFGGSAIILFLRDREIRFRRMESLKKEKIEYQFETLKSQVNPHFLFNSFNTLISIIEEDKSNAVDYVEKLSDYFRNMIQHRDKDTISLSEELQMVNTYYYLQKKRFGDNLSVNIDIPEIWKHEYRVPPLSLQLLIENAVKHNAVSHETPLLIEVTASNDESLIIKNNLNRKITTDTSTGIGLINIVHRFQILTTRELKIRRTETEFIVEVPLIKV
jgi:ligand-binding sensor domain-containing protein